MSVGTRRSARGAAIALAIGLVASGCTVNGDAPPPVRALEDDDPVELAPIILQLPDTGDARFAGYIIAVDLGYYADEGLDVEIVVPGDRTPPSGPEPEQLPDFTVADLAWALEQAETDAEELDFGDTVPEEPGTEDTAPDEPGTEEPDTGDSDPEASDTGDTTPEDTDREAPDIEPDADTDGDADVFAIAQNFALAASPTPSWSGAVWADAERLEADEDYADAAVRLLAASTKGWIFARDSPDEAARILRAAGPAPDEAPRVSEMNALLWPAEAGFGIIDDDAWRDAVESARTTAADVPRRLLDGDGPAVPYTNVYIERALDALEGERIDITGDRG